MHACSAYRNSNRNMFRKSEDLEILKSSQGFLENHMNLLRTFCLSCVSTEITNWLKSMQNPRELFVNKFILNKIAKF